MTAKELISKNNRSAKFQVGILNNSSFYGYHKILTKTVKEACRNKEVKRWSVKSDYYDDGAIIYIEI